MKKGLILVIIIICVVSSLIGCKIETIEYEKLELGMKFSELDLINSEGKFNKIINKKNILLFLYLVKNAEIVQSN